jgi:hypothetical protein
MQLFLTGDDTVPVKFIGCGVDSNLEYELERTYKKL